MIRYGWRMRFCLLFALLVTAVPGLAQVQSLPALATPVISRDAAGIVTLKGDNVLYTLDGTDPISKSNPYLAPIVLACGGTVKARAFSEDRKTMSPVATATFDPLPGHAALPSTVVPVTQDRSWPSTLGKAPRAHQCRREACEAADSLHRRLHHTFLWRPAV
jgi:hypothetical protein